MRFKFSFLKIMWVCGFVLFFAILYFDFRVYEKFILDIELRAQEESTKNLFLFKTPLLEKAVVEIRKKDEFLQSPNYPLIKDPF